MNLTKEAAVVSLGPLREALEDGFEANVDSTPGVLDVEPHAALIRRGADG
jgi:hypothetical protein